MKNSLYAIAGLLIVLTPVAFLSFDSMSMVHIILAIAGIIIVIGFNNQTSSK